MPSIPSSPLRALSSRNRSRKKSAGSSSEVSETSTTPPTPPRTPQRTASISTAQRTTANSTPDRHAPSARVPSPPRKEKYDSYGRSSTSKGSSRRIIKAQSPPRITSQTYDYNVTPDPKTGRYQKRSPKGVEEFDEEEPDPGDPEPYFESGTSYSSNASDDESSAFADLESSVGASTSEEESESLLSEESSEEEDDEVVYKKSSNFRKASRREVDMDDDDEEYTVETNEDTVSDGGTLSEANSADSYVGGADLVDMDFFHIISPFKDDNTLNDTIDEDTIITNKDGGDTEAGENKKAFNLIYKLGANDYTLKEMDIDCSSIQREMAKDIADLLPKNNRLQRIRLSAPNEECMDNFRILLGGLARNTSITDVQICNTNLGREAASWLGSSLAQNQSGSPLVPNQSVQKLCLRNCKFVESGLPVLFLGLQHNKKIRELFILQCDLSANSNSDVVAASIPLMKLTSLCLIDTRLSLNGLRFILENIEHTPSLMQLNLSINKKLGMPAGIKLLSNMLRSSKLQVKTLTLSSCYLDGHCVAELAKALAHNTTVTNINLSGNRFGDEGASYLKKLLERNNSIKELQVKGCEIGRRRQRAIADGLRYNNSVLKSLFSKDTSLAIFDAVENIEQFGDSLKKAAAGV